jgi:hypothetical protein
MTFDNGGFDEAASFDGVEFKLDESFGAASSFALEEDFSFTTKL